MVCVTLCTAIPWYILRLCKVALESKPMCSTFSLYLSWRRVRFPLLRREGREGGNRAVRGWKVLHMGFNSSATLHSLRTHYGKAVQSVTYTAHVPTVHLLGHPWSKQGVSFGATQVAWLRHHHYLVRRTSSCSVRWLRLRHPLTYP